MANTKISDETAAGTLDGTEIVPVVKGGANRRTTSQDIADLASLSGAAGGDLGGTYPNPTVTQARGLRETAGPTTLTMGAVADGDALVRSGSTVVGATPPGFSHVAVSSSGATLPTRNAVVSCQVNGAGATTNLTLPAAVAGRVYIVRKTGGAATDTLTLVRAGSESIDGVAASRLLPASNESVNTSPQLWPTWLVTCDGTNWHTSILASTVHVRMTNDPTSSDTIEKGYLPGSTWHANTNDRFWMLMGTKPTSGDPDWVRIDKVEPVSVTSGTTALTHQDSAIFVDTTSGVVTLNCSSPSGRYKGTQYVITRTNASGTNKITISFPAGNQSVNGAAAAASYDLPGSDTEDLGRWHMISDGSTWWVTGGSGLV